MSDTTPNGRQIILKPLAVALFMLWLSGCSFSQGGNAPVTYLLDAEPEPAAAGMDKPGRGVLLLATPRAEAAFDTTAIAYSRAPLALEYYRDSRWADTPARMLEPLLARALEQSRAFRAVVTQPTLVAADLQLNVKLVQLQQEFFEQPSRLRLVLRASLTDPASNKVLATRRFEALVPAASENAYGGVQAASAALNELVPQLVAFAASRGRS